MMHATRRPLFHFVTALLLVVGAQSAVPYDLASQPTYVVGQWAIFQTTDNGSLAGCLAVAETKDKLAALTVATATTGELHLILFTVASLPDALNQVVQYKIDATDFGNRRGDINAGSFIVPLDQDPMLEKLPGAKQVTVTFRGTTYVFDVAGSAQVLGSLKSCLTAPLSASADDSRGFKANKFTSVTTLTCAFRPARTSGTEYSVDISFDEGQRRILNREVIAGPDFSETDIRWREPRDNKAFADYVLDRHSGAARIYVGLPKEHSGSLVDVGTCQLAPERRF